MKKNIINELLKFGIGYLQNSVLWRPFFRITNPSLCIKSGVSLKIKSGGNLRAKKNVLFPNSSITIQKNGFLHLKEHSWIGPNSAVDANRIIIGRYSALHSQATVYGDVFIGEYVMIAKNVFISSGQHIFDFIPELPIKLQDKKYFSENPDKRSLPVLIEDDVWIGANCTLKNGITIGKGSVIGANSVVTEDVFPYSIVAGAPAKKIKNRLEFCPPKALKSSSIESLPYFYSGFDLNHIKSFESHSNPAFLMRAYSEFSVALNQERETKLTIIIKALYPEAILSFLEQQKTVSADFTEIVYSLENSSGSLPFRFVSNFEKESECFEVSGIFIH